MRGDTIGEERGKVTGRRALKSGDPRYLKMEISFETQATLYGVPCMNIGTYEVFERIPGQLYGEGPRAPVARFPAGGREQPGQRVNQLLPLPHDGMNALRRAMGRRPRRSRRHHGRRARG